jgi:RNA polymerase sigma-70 factor, ECF subfamily
LIFEQEDGMLKKELVDQGKETHAMHARTHIKNPVMANSDAELVWQSLDNNEQAFELLFQRYRPALFKFISRYFGDYDQSCDILQQVFLQLYLSLPRLDTRRPLKNWLFQVARNRCLDELRRKRPVRLSELESDDEDEEKSLLALIRDPGPLPDEIAEQREQQARLLRAIEALPAKFRPVVYLRYTRQFSFVEIGKQLGIPETTAKTHFHRARMLLQASLSAASH